MKSGLSSQAGKEMLEIIFKGYIRVDHQLWKNVRDNIK